MKELVNSRFGSFAVFNTAWMMMSIVGYQYSFLNPVLPAIKDIFNSTYTARNGNAMSEAAWLPLLTISTTAIIIGSILGAVFSKPLNNFLSTKHAMQLCHILNIVGILVVALVGGLTNSYEAFIVGRIIEGLPCGIIFNLAPITIAEMSAKSRQNGWQSLTGVAMVFGILAGSILGHPKVFGSIDLWPVAASGSAVPSLIYLISSIWIPETPFYLVRSGKKDEALKSLNRLRSGLKDDIQKELSETISQIKSAEVVSIGTLVCTRKYLPQLAIVMAIYCNMMLIGINNIVFYSDFIFISAGIAAENATFATIGIFALDLVFAIVGLFVIKRTGAYRLLMISNIVIIFAQGLFIISRATAVFAPEVMPNLTIVATAGIMAFWSGGSTVASFALLGQVTVESTRPSALGLGSICFYITSWFVGFIGPYLEENLDAYSFVLWLVCTVINTICFRIFLPNTNGKSEDEIQTELLGNRLRKTLSNESSTSQSI